MILANKIAKTTTLEEEGTLNIEKVQVV